LVDEVRLIFTALRDDGEHFELSIMGLGLFILSDIIKCPNYLSYNMILIYYDLSFCKKAKTRFLYGPLISIIKHDNQRDFYMIGDLVVLFLNNIDIS
jgi:hypothetical protein